MTELITIVVGIIGMVKNKDKINLQYFISNIILVIGVVQLLNEIFRR